MLPRLPAASIQLLSHAVEAGSAHVHWAVHGLVAGGHDAEEEDQLWAIVVDVLPF
jgi:hypothetical protein